MARDEKQYVALRIGALVGLKRHTTLGISPSVQPQLAEALLAILATPIAEESNPDGQIWLRLDAADVLHLAMGNKQFPVDQAKFAAALVGQIDDERTPNWARAKLAGDLGKLTGRSLPPAQVPVAARSLASLMLSVCQTSPFALDAGAQKEDEAAKKGTDKKNADKKGTDKKNTDKKNTDKKSGDKAADKKDKGNGKQGDSNVDKPDAATVVATEPASPAVQKINGEEMMWQLSQIRAALYGKDAPTTKDKGAPDAAFGLRAAAAENDGKMIDKVVGHIDGLVRLLVDVPDGKDVFSKLADNLRTTGGDLEGMLNVPAEEEKEATAAAKPVEGRPRPPAGNAPGDVSATAK
jgi:hypothetical protein